MTGRAGGGVVGARIVRIRLDEVPELPSGSGGRASVDGRHRPLEGERSFVGVCGAIVPGERAANEVLTLLGEARNAE